MGSWAEDLMSSREMADQAASELRALDPRHPLLICGQAEESDEFFDRFWRGSRPWRKTGRSSGLIAIRIHTLANYVERVKEEVVRLHGIQQTAR